MITFQQPMDVQWALGTRASNACLYSHVLIMNLSLLVVHHLNYKMNIYLLLYNILFPQNLWSSYESFIKQQSKDFFFMHDVFYPPPQYFDYGVYNKLHIMST